MGVGAFLDFQATIATRAPNWMIERRLEWVYRLIREPRRLGPRYILGNPRFVLRAVRDALSRQDRPEGVL